MPAPKFTPEQFLDAALAKVESKSIRAWAQSDHNRPLWLNLAGNTLQKHGDAASTDGFAAFVVLSALG